MRWVAYSSHSLSAARQCKQQQGRVLLGNALIACVLVVSCTNVSSKCWAVCSHSVYGNKSYASINETQQIILWIHQEIFFAVCFATDWSCLHAMLEGFGLLLKTG